ncbi:MAG TPA: alpha/beta hydrolase [Actinomycetota bacterium]|nr:alpha/beta hydrolase [Actinomycetota bacterium]
MELVRDAVSFLRPPGWRGKTPRPEHLEGAALFAPDDYVESFDSTEIAYSVHGTRGPWVVLVPGFVCSDTYWKYLLPELTKDHRVLVYDLRGHGRSGLPRSPGYRARHLTPDDFAIPNHVLDLEAVMDAAGIERATLIGHSMGGQVIMEAYRMIPERIASLVMLTAPFESPLRTFYGRDFSSFFHKLRIAGAVLPRPSVLLWRAAVLGSLGVTHQIGQLMRALGPYARLEDMAPYYRHIAFLDPTVVLMMAEAMQRHSADDVLETISVPVLIVAGDLDTFTPLPLGRLMAEKIPNAELVVIEDASHAAVIEKPLEINAAIHRFLTRVEKGEVYLGV